MYFIEVLRGTKIINHLRFKNSDVAIEQWQKIHEQARNGDFLRFFIRGSLFMDEIKRDFSEYQTYHIKQKRAF